MPQDAFTLRHLCRELNNIFAGGKINKIVMPSPDSVVFTVYTKGRIDRFLISALPSMPGIGITTKDARVFDFPPFCQLLRKHLLGATINSVELVGFDRIVKISLTPSKEFFDQADKVLFVELMGRYSNIILTENGKVLGGNRGINMYDNGVRTLFTGHDYVFPPSNGKLLPNDPEIKKLFVNSDDLAETIVNHVQGVAKSTAAWIVLSYAERLNMDIHDVCLYVSQNPDDFFTYMNMRLYSEDIRPCIEYKDGEMCDVYAIPYGGGEYKFFDFLYVAEGYYFSEKQKNKELADLSQRANAIISAKIKKAEKRLNILNQREKETALAEDYRIKGELILSNIYKIRKGDGVLICDNYYDGTKTEIFLDRSLSPSQNAETFFKKYNKLKRTENALIPQLESAKKDMDYFFSVRDEISLCETADDYKAILNELRPVSDEKQKKKSDAPSARIYEKDGFTIRVGRSNIENDKIVSSASRDSIWLHVKDYHSSHVIIDVKSKTVPDYIIKFGAELSAYYSKCRGESKAEVVYTMRKFVKKPAGAKPGFVTYDNFKSVVVTPNKHEEFIKAD